MSNCFSQVSKVLTYKSVNECPLEKLGVGAVLVKLLLYYEVMNVYIMSQLLLCIYIVKTHPRNSKGPRLEAVSVFFLPKPGKDSS